MVAPMTVTSEPSMLRLLPAETLEPATTVLSLAFSVKLFEATSWAATLACVSVFELVEDDDRKPEPEPLALVVCWSGYLTPTIMNLKSYHWPAQVTSNSDNGNFLPSSMQRTSL